MQKLSPIRVLKFFSIRTFSKVSKSIAHTHTHTRTHTHTHIHTQAHTHTHTRTHTRRGLNVPASCPSEYNRYEDVQQDQRKEEHQSFRQHY